MIEQRASRTDLIRWGQEKARTSAWHGESGTALITLLPDCPLLSADFIRHCLRRLADQGYTSVKTGALSPLEQSAFLAAGFGVEGTLRVLTLEIGEALPEVSSGLPLRRVARRRQKEILAVDRAAFEPFWQFDALALADALGATPSVHFRMARSPNGTVAGYAISGRSGRRGFVQRLAVHPSGQGRGTGRRLLIDGLRWMQRHGVTKAAVNTQTDNEAALALYLKTGFLEEPTGLSVLSASLA